VKRKESIRRFDDVDATPFQLLVRDTREKSRLRAFLIQVFWGPDAPSAPVPWLIHELSPFSRKWRAVYNCTALSAAFLIPIGIGWNKQLGPFFLRFSVATTGIFETIFAANLLLNFFVTVSVNKTELLTHREIALRYLRTHFFIDLLCSVPSSAFESGDYRWTELLPMVKTLRLQAFFGRRSVEQTTLSILQHPLLTICSPTLRIAAFLLIFNHAMGCIWYWILCRENNFATEQFWLDLDPQDSVPRGVGFLTDETLNTQYWRCFFVVLCCTNGGDVHPQTGLEVTFNIICLLVGAFGYTIMFGTFTTLLEDMGKETSWISERTSTLRQASQFYDLPPKLTMAIRAFFLFRFHQMASFQEDDFLEQLSGDLRRHVLWFRYSDILKKVPLFGNCSDLLFEEIAGHLSPEAFGVGDVLFAEGDLADKLHTILNGSVKIKGATFEKLVSEATTLGEMCLLTSKPQTRTATVTATTFVNAATLSKETFNQVMFRFEEDRAQVIMNVVLRLDYVLTVNDLGDMGIEPILLAQMIKNALSKIFVEFDKDHSGALSKAELEVMMGAELCMSPKNMQKVLNHMQGQEMVFNEFFRVVAGDALYELLQTERDSALGAFGRLDTNYDGVLTMTELSKLDENDDGILSTEELKRGLGGLVADGGWENSEETLLMELSDLLRKKKAGVDARLKELKERVASIAVH
jgi:Ca2+-binding EF-hand superfamily protein